MYKKVRCTCKAVVLSTKSILVAVASSDCKVPIRDFKIQRRGRQRERQKTIGFISKTTTLHVHRTYLYISFPVFARLRRENA